MHNSVIKILTIEGKGVFKRGTQRNSVFSENFSGDVLVVRFSPIA